MAACICTLHSKLFDHIQKKNVIAQPLTCWLANPEVRGSSSILGLNLSPSQRLGTGMLLGGDREIML